MELDIKRFKVLSSKSRVDILKLLKQRRMTLSELSIALKMHVSTVKEHLDKLGKAGFVELHDEKHKWKYYALTRDGKQIISPYAKEITILLTLSLTAFVITAIQKLLFMPIRQYTLVKAPMLQEATEAAKADVTYSTSYRLFSNFFLILTFAFVVGAFFFYIKRRRVLKY